MLLTLARLAGRSQLFFADGKQLTQLFPQDVLAMHCLELEPTLALEREQIAGAIELAAAVRKASAAAGKSDYVSAARLVDALGSKITATGPSSEPGLRARVAQVVFGRAGIRLSDLDDEKQDKPQPPPWPRVSSAYADYLIVRLAPTKQQHAQYQQRRDRIIATASPERVALLDVMYGPPDACPVPVVPSMGQPSDLLFAGQLALALDDKATPGGAPRGGKLLLEPWLARYDKAVLMTEQHQAGWAFVGALLQQRGTLHGLSAEGTTTYKRVSQMAHRHIAALRKLAEAEPARFAALSVVSLIYKPGVFQDPGLRAAVSELVASSVEQKIRAAGEVSEVYEAALAAFALGISSPSYVQGAQLGALRKALQRKLEGAFAAHKGWGVAGLHAASGVVDKLLGKGDGLKRAVSRVATSLGGNVPYPSLAKLVTSIARYGQLIGSDKLDATVANPKMFSPQRAAARIALRAAIAGFDDAGPQSLADKELLGHVTDLADGLIAAVAALLTRDDGDKPSCDSAPAITTEGPLRDVFDRLQKKRRLMLKQRAFSRGAGVWLSRARLLAVVLSDVLDVADKSSSLRFAVVDKDAQRIANEALRAWASRDSAQLATSLYLIVRATAGEQKTDLTAIRDNSIRALGALAKLFGDSRGGARASFFAALAKADVTKTLPTSTDGLAPMIADYAKRAYSQGAVDQGDLLMMMALGATIAKSKNVSSALLELAREQKRPVLLPLMLYSKNVRESGDPSDFESVVRDATSSGCQPPDPKDVLTVRRAIFDFRSGRRSQARKKLEELLSRAERQGLVVPRQVYRYVEKAGDKLFNAEQSMSLGGNLLNSSGTFQVGLGMQRGGDAEDQKHGRFTATFADTKTLKAQKESARYYAHVAILAAVFHGLDKARPQALLAARRALVAWNAGVRLGPTAVLSGEDTAKWAQDAGATIAIAAQQAAEADEAFLSGALWSMARKALGDQASDESVGKLLDPLPATLRGIADLSALAKRAASSLETLAAPLACTNKPGRGDQLARVDCKQYPVALGLRIAEGLSKLPRLKPGAEAKLPNCRAWRELDGFLGAADQRRYEPTKFVAAVGALRSSGRLGDAAVLLADQRHARHCTPSLIAHARALAQRTELGAHLRGDVLSVAVTCSDPKKVLADIKLLDQLTAKHPLPVRNFELLVFAARVAKQAGNFAPLLAMTSRPDYLPRWQRLGPDMATIALLLHHAAATLATKAVDKTATLSFYRLLCTTFPAKKRGALCNTIGLLRAASATTDLKQVASQALAQFIGTGAAILQAQRPSK